MLDIIICKAIMAFETLICEKKIWRKYDYRKYKRRSIVS